jgi:uncharacterized protein (DUF2147 family)
MRRFLLIPVALCFTLSLQAQSVVGKWKTYDDDTGKARSVVEIYKQDEKVYGRIVELIDPPRPNPICVACKGDEKDQPVVGLVIINGLEEDGDEYNSGRILDPESGKRYKCYITLDDEDTLKVRGYIGFSAIGRTQYWQRVK